MTAIYDGFSRFCKTIVVTWCLVSKRCFIKIESIEMNHTFGGVGYGVSATVCVIVIVAASSDLEIIVIENILALLLEFKWDSVQIPNLLPTQFTNCAAEFFETPQHQNELNYEIASVVAPVLSELGSSFQRIQLSFIISVS